VKWLTNLLRPLKQDSARGHAPIHREPEPTPAPPRGTQAFIRAGDGWQPVVSAEELEATIRQLRKVEAERDAALEDLERTKRVLDKIDAVRTHQSEKLVRVYEASGAEPQHFDCIDKFVGVMRVAFAAIEAMGYEWRWTKSIDADGEQVGAWVMREAEAAAAAAGSAEAIGAIHKAKEVQP
jgi:hypothetical protein